MGQRKFREQVTAPSFNPVISFTSTAAIIKNRLVKLANTGNIKHTTGTSGRVILGVALAGATGAGKKIPVQLFGQVQVHASTKAIAIADWVRATSGAASTASNLGGTIRTTTVNNQILGVALSSAAAAAAGTQRLVTIFLNPTINTIALT
jgi:uncharacterized protein DUF2190